jgi:hypothetical protein
LINSLAELDWCNYTLSVTSDNIEAIISEFEQAFGDHQNCVLYMKAYNGSKYKPSIRIKEDDSFIELYLEIHIKNPLEPSIDAAVIVAKASASIVFTVGKDFKVHGEIDSMNLKAVQFEPYFKTETKKVEIQ